MISTKHCTRAFYSVQEARDYRHNKNAGGWIFEPENGGGVAMLFPPDLSPHAITLHPLAKGRKGRLLAP